MFEHGARTVHAGLNRSTEASAVPASSTAAQSA